MLDGLGQFGRAELSAAGALVSYLELTQKGKFPALKPLKREADVGRMAIDPATRRNLELTETLSGERRGSLLSVIDCTVTAAGARLLYQRLSAPLTDPPSIARRLDAVAYFLKLSDLRDRIRAALKSAPDIARALSRLDARARRSARSRRHPRWPCRFARACVASSANGPIRSAPCAANWTRSSSA